MGSLPGKGPGAEMPLAPTYPLFSTGLTQSLSMPCGHSVITPHPSFGKGLLMGRELKGCDQRGCRQHPALFLLSTPHTLGSQTPGRTSLNGPPTHAQENSLSSGSSAGTSLPAAWGAGPGGDCRAGTALLHRAGTALLHQGTETWKTCQPRVCAAQEQAIWLLFLK